MEGVVFNLGASLACVRNDGIKAKKKKSQTR
jgi:hypothetical protein